MGHLLQWQLIKSPIPEWTRVSLSGSLSYVGSGQPYVSYDFSVV